MGSPSVKRVLGLVPAVALALVGLLVILLEGQVVEGVVVIALAALGAASYYLVLAVRGGARRQQQLARRIARLEAANKRAVDVARRSLRSTRKAAARNLEQLELAEERNADRLTRLEKLLLSQQDEVSQALDATRGWSSDVDAINRLVSSTSAESHKHLVAIKRRLHAMEQGEHGGSLRRNLNADMAALVEVSRHAQAGVPLPVPSKWAMSPQVLELALRVVRNHPDIELVVELGSGVSTAWVGDVLRARGRGRLVSFEHDPHFLATTREAVEAAGVADFVDLRLAPLTGIDLEGEHFQWYDVTADLEGVGLLVVDGPPGATGPAARYPALPVLHAALRDGAFVILDDASRPEEQEILDRWLAFKADGMHVSLVEMVDRAALLRVHRS